MPTNLLGQAKQPLTRLARLADASLKDVDAARRAMEEARVVMGPTRALCDIIIAEPLEAKVQYQPDDWDKEKHQIHKSQAACIRQPRHLPAFVHSISR